MRFPQMDGQVLTINRALPALFSPCWVLALRPHPLVWTQASGLIVQQKAKGIGGMGYSPMLIKFVKPLAFWL